MGKKTAQILLLVIIIVGAFFRFYKLDWGEGLFTHPDEQNIIGAVSQLSFPNQMNPHFFAYGSITIYLIYFAKELSAISYQLSDLNPFLIGRFYSALFSTLSIFLVYKISQKILSDKFALLAAFFTATTAGLIQQAHFLTPESTLIFFLLESLLYLLNFLASPKLVNLSLASFFLGLSIGTKVSAAVFLLPLLLVILIKSWPKLLTIINLSVLSVLIIGLTFAITNPFALLDFPQFRSSLEYEGGVASGQIQVFYTRQFINTTPILFQLEKIYPYALGPALLVLGILGMLGLFYLILKPPHNTYYIILTTAFLSLFLPNAFLFAKWTRFSSPTFPFFAIFAAFLLFKFSQFQMPRFFSSLLLTTCYILPILWTLAFFSIYTHPDIRHEASKWIKQNLPPHSIIITETRNVTEVPLDGQFERILVDFYEMGNDPTIIQKANSALSQADYFIIQSRRVFANHQRLPDKFPETTQFYQDLFSGKSGFAEVRQFDSYPTLSLLGKNIEFPDEQAEETWSVFDHPVIRVFKKV